MKTASNPSSHQYYWRCGSSRIFSQYFFCFHSLSALLLLALTYSGVLNPVLLLLVLSALVAIATLVYGRHPALAGQVIELSLQTGRGLCRMRTNPQGAIAAEPCEVVSCRWIGSGCVVATVRPQSTSLWQRYLGLGDLHLVLCGDNSNANDRHRLAMQYYSGAF